MRAICGIEYFHLHAHTYERINWHVHRTTAKVRARLSLMFWVEIYGAWKLRGCFFSIHSLSLSFSFSSALVRHNKPFPFCDLYIFDTWALFKVCSDAFLEFLIAFDWYALGRSVACLRPINDGMRLDLSDMFWLSLFFFRRFLYDCMAFNEFMGLLQPNMNAEHTHTHTHSARRSTERWQYEKLSILV